MLGSKVWNRNLSGESHIDFRTNWIIMIQSIWTPAHCYLRHFQIFDKIDSSPKKVLNVSRLKKANYSFEELSNLYLIVMLISFFPILLWITAENITKLKKLFIWTTKSSRTQHYKHENCTRLCINNWNNVSDILDLKWFLQKFFNPANTQSVVSNRRF